MLLWGAAAPRLLSHGQRGDSRGTARSRSPEPCPAVPSQPRTAGRAAGSAAATAPRAGPSWLGTAGLAPARIFPLPTAAPVPPPPRPSRDKAHGRVCCSPGHSPPLATFIPNHAPRAHAGSAGTAGTGCRAPRHAAVGCSRVSPRPRGSLPSLSVGTARSLPRGSHTSRWLRALGVSPVSPSRAGGAPRAPQGAGLPALTGGRPALP